jgi:hypothetical protein
MDPYLEQHWGDVHHRLITYACDTLQKILPANLRARLEERVLVESPQVMRRRIIPDVRIIEQRRKKPRSKTAVATSTAAEPVVVYLDEPVTEGFIEIRERSPAKRLVTVIELMSPSNKLPGAGQDQYRQKQRELREARVSLVEIDLLRAGNRVFPFSTLPVPADLLTPYQVFVCRGWEPTAVEVYRVPLRERLPTIKIPLRRADKDAPLDLQALLDQGYRNGGYDEDVDYNDDLVPPLESADARWADALLRRQGVRRRRGPASSGRRANGRRQP